MTIRVLDPTNEAGPGKAQPAPRLDTLAGKTVGFISNGKEGTARYFHHLGMALKARYGIAGVVLQTKSNYSAPADAHIVNGISEWDAMMSGIGD
jgi:hypothetical protein